MVAFKALSVPILALSAPYLLVCFCFIVFPVCSIYAERLKCDPLWVCVPDSTVSCSSHFHITVLHSPSVSCVTILATFCGQLLALILFSFPAASHEVARLLCSKRWPCPALCGLSLLFAPLFPGCCSLAPAPLVPAVPWGLPCCPVLSLDDLIQAYGLEHPLVVDDPGFKLRLCLHRSLRL